MKDTTFNRNLLLIKVLVLFLLVLLIINITILSSIFVNKYNFILRKHVFIILFSAMCFITITRTNVTYIVNASYIIYILFLLLLIINFLFVNKVMGVKRWFYLGEANLQPAEFIKIAIILAIS